MPLDPEKLSPRDRRLLGVFRRHAALTPPAAQVLACPEDSLDAVMKLARRLGHRGWLETHRLPDGGVYYVPTRRAARALGLPKRRRQGLSQDGAVEHLGTLWLCLKENVQKRPAADLRGVAPGLFRRGLASTAYGVGADGRLVWLIVDHWAKPARLAAKAAHAVEERERLPAFRKLIDQGGFGVLIAVPTAAKAVEVEAAVVGHQVNRFVTVRVVVLPELLPLLMQGN
jgi:hypothetical protein